MQSSFARNAAHLACAAFLALALCGCGSSDASESDVPSPSGNGASAASSASCFELLPFLAGADAATVEQDPSSYLTDSGYASSIDADSGIIGITPANVELVNGMELVAGASETSDLIVVRKQGDAGFGYPSYSRTSLWTTPADNSELPAATEALCNLIGSNEIIATYSYTADSQCYALAFASCQINGTDCLLTVSAMQLENSAERCDFFITFAPLGSSSCPETTYEDVIATMDSRYVDHV